MKPLVSICCITYNHEKYIRQTIESFLCQKVDFEYEVLIYDDASTDNTANIIKEYELKYPNIIKGIYQTENQYSKGVKNVLNKTVYPIAQGQYIAICEGDDFWNSEFKLKKQIEFLEINKDCSMCVHASNMLNMKKNTREVIKYSEEDTFVSTEEIITNGGGIFSTSTIVIRKNCIVDMPSYFLGYNFTDFQIFINASLLGNVYYLSEPMATYRFLSNSSSWSSDITDNNQKLIEHYLDVIKMLDDLNINTNKIYNNCIIQAILNYRYKIKFYQKDYRSLKKDPFKQIYKKKKFIYKIKVNFKIYLNYLFGILL